MFGETLSATPADQETTQPTQPMTEAERRVIACAPVAQLALTRFTQLSEGVWDREVLQEATYTH